MPEYMDYDSTSYDYKSKAQKIRSNIAFVLSVVFLVSVVVWVIVRQPKTVRTHFEEVTSKKHGFSEKFIEKENEFLVLRERLKKSSLPVGEDFFKEFPNVSKLLKMKKSEIAKDKVESFDFDSCFVLAKVIAVSRDVDSSGEYLDEDKDYVIGIIGIDFLVIKHGNVDGKLNIESPIKFSVRYHNGSGVKIKYIEEYHADQTRFKLNFYTMKVKFVDENAFSKFDAQLRFTESINKEQAKKSVFASKMTVNAKNAHKTVFSGNRQGDKHVSCNFGFDKTKKTTLKIEFDDEMYNKFERLIISGLSKECGYYIKIN